MAKFIDSVHAQHHGGKISARYIVLHDTVGFPAGDLQVLKTGGGRNVSVHALIMPDGTVYRMLPLTTGANHAGFAKSSIAARYPANQHSIGIELSHPPKGGAYPLAQLQALDEYIRWVDKSLHKRLPIYGHREIDPTRRSDPRPPFPLTTYKRYRKHFKPATVVKKVVAILHKFVPPKKPSILRVGDSGYWVKKLQKALHIKDDGVFGSDTEAAVEKAQKTHGIARDGVVGKTTFKHLHV